VATAGLFLVSGAGASMPLMSLPGRAAADLKTLASRPVSAAIAVVFVAVSVASVIFFPREGRGVDTAAVVGNATEEERAAFEEWYAGQRRIPVAIPAEGASVLVVKFNDYQCPWCARTWEDYKGIFAKFDASHPGAVRLVVLDYPLEAECNSNATSTAHEGACEAAAAVRLAREHGRGEAMEEYLYTNQPKMTAQSVRQWAREVGQVTDFDSRYAAALEGVKADIARGVEMGVRSTPTFIIAGTLVEGALAPHLFEHAINYELERARK
jgi:protein-disulfide isomerase